MDLQSTLEEYQIQFEQVEISLKNDPYNSELLKLKVDLEEVIKLTNELIGETENEKMQEEELPATNIMSTCKQIRWKAGDKCLALWKTDGK
jgi:survival of motor neuron-related-splicing factor 30